MFLLFVLNTICTLSGSGFAKHLEHIFLVCLYSRLIEGIDTAHISGYSAGQFKEYHHFRKAFFVSSGYLHYHIGNTALNMSRSHSISYDLPNLSKVAPCKVIQPVCISFIERNCICFRFRAEANDSLHQVSGTVLYELAH